MGDIRRFAVEPTGRLHFKDANEELMYDDEAGTKPVAVRLYGPGSKQYAKAQAAQNNRMMDKLKQKGKSNQTADQSVAERAEFLADCTDPASWENLDYDGLSGDALSRAVYADTSLGFMAEQAAKFIGDWGNFYTGSAKS